MQVFCCYAHDRGFWFRLFGYGLFVSNYSLTFSQRNGYKKYLKIGNWKITLLGG